MLHGMGCRRGGGPGSVQIVSSAVPVDISDPAEAGKHRELGHGIVDIRFHGFRRPSRFGEMGTSAFFQPEAESLIFLLRRSRDAEIGVRLSRKDLIQLEGKVIKVLGSGIMEVLCDNDVTVTGRLSGRMKMHRIKVMAGDQVHVSVSPYDPSHGLITYRLK
jgi:translation initiation factor IF-1